jgi:small GTP-binding protein
MESVKLVAVGDGNVGKTALLVTYAENSFPFEHVPTVFDNYTAGTEFKGKNICLNIWDTAGQEEYARLRALSYPETDIFLACFDVENKNSYANMTKWITEIRHHAPEAKVLLVATKIDMRKEVPNAISMEEGKALAEKLHVDGYAECSAMLRDGVTEVFEAALEIIVVPAHVAPKKKRKHACPLL